MRSALISLLCQVQTLQGNLLGLLMLCMTTGYASNVLVREIAPSLAPHLAWMDEVSLFGLVWMVFLALGLALESGRHISMRMLLSRVPQSGRRIIAIAVNLMGLVFSAYMIKVGVEIALFVARSGQASPTLGISTAWLYWAVPLGFALLAIQYLVELLGWSDRFSREVDPMHHV
jgi:C4-dicarboxylate transporter DctQ subunit